jgi:preprotein translocase subunit SecG
MITYYLVTAVHVIVCLILILVVLLQSGKGADLAGAFGGGGTQTAFGSRGPASFLSKLTTVSAIVFMITCLALSLMGTKTQSRSILDTTKGSAAPPAKPAAAQPQQQAPAPSPEEIKKMQSEIEAKQKQTPPAGSTPVEAAPAKGSETKSTPSKETKPPDAGKKP